MSLLAVHTALTTGSQASQTLPRLKLGIPSDRAARILFARWTIDSLLAAKIVYMGLAFTGNMVNTASLLDNIREFLGHRGFFLTNVWESIVSATGSTTTLLTTTMPSEIVLGSDPYVFVQHDTAEAFVRLELEYDLVRVSSDEKLRLTGQGGYTAARVQRTV